MARCDRGCYYGTFHAGQAQGCRARADCRVHRPAREHGGRRRRRSRRTVRRIEGLGREIRRQPHSATQVPSPAGHHRAHEEHGNKKRKRRPRRARHVDAGQGTGRGAAILFLVGRYGTAQVHKNYQISTRSRRDRHRLRVRERVATRGTNGHCKGAQQAHRRHC